MLGGGTCKRLLSTIVVLAWPIFVADPNVAAAGPQRAEGRPGISPPVVTSDNVELVGTFPDELLIGTAFSSDTPYLYASTFTGITVYDVSNPEQPLPVGRLPMSVIQNEDVSLGERKDGTKFVLVAFDSYSGLPLGTTPTFTPEKPATKNEIAVVDVTDPRRPTVVARMKTSTLSHTVTCINPECTYAYTSGGSYDTEGEKKFSIIDLRNHTAPTEVKTYRSSIGYIGHDWEVDSAGIAWHVGADGAVAYDISDPLNPVVLNSTGARSLQRMPWNKFIYHNSARPFGERFVAGAPSPRSQRETGVKPHPRDGNVLLVTEERIVPDCKGGGDFMTLSIPSLRSTGKGRIKPGTGTIEPLDRWQPTLFDTEEPAPAGAACTAHYFTFHQRGFVAISFANQGLRILDVRDPSHIKQVGYFYTGHQVVEGGAWVPERDENGVVTGRMTNIVYSEDLVRGLDVLRVKFPKTDPEDTQELAGSERPQSSS